MFMNDTEQTKEVAGCGNAGMCCGGGCGGGCGCGTSPSADATENKNEAPKE